MIENSASFIFPRSCCERESCILHPRRPSICRLPSVDCPASALASPGSLGSSAPLSTLLVQPPARDPICPHSGRHDLVDELSSCSYIEQQLMVPGPSRAASDQWLPAMPATSGDGFRPRSRCAVPITCRSFPRSGCGAKRRAINITIVKPLPLPCTTVSPWPIPKFR